MQGKSMDFGAERKRGGEGTDKGRPGGMRGGTEPPVGSSGRDFIGYPLNTAEPGKGLAVFNRSVHSAGLGKGARQLVRTKRKMGKGGGRGRSHGVQMVRNLLTL